MSTCIQNKALTRKDKTLKQIPNTAWRASNTNRAEAHIQEKNMPSNSRASENSREQLALNCGYLIFLFTIPGAIRGLLWSLMGYQNVDLKQIDCQLFLQQKWVQSELAENCNLRSATMVSHVQVPSWQEENTFQREKGS